MAGRVFVPIGNRAQTPYYVKNADIHVYSIEELCYVICENAFVLEDSLVDRDLVSWIDHSLGLKDLAKSLHELMNQNGSAGALAGIILDYTGNYDTRQVNYVENILQTGSGLTTYEKRRHHADYMLSVGKYIRAVEEYQELLGDMPDADRKFHGDVLCNMGTALANLFLYQEAADAFARAADLLPEDQTIIQAYLAAVRMYAPTEEYIRFISAHPEWNRASMALEADVSTLERDWTYSPEYVKTKEITDGKQYDYFDEIHRRIQNLKYDYRESASDEA
ncbi:MAG: hypothetical protein K5682_01530 [Lachnospiraceae bacterium]|nr:hypothetical protein [Lachnospiraceae bacterium]